MSHDTPPKPAQQNILVDVDGEILDHGDEALWALQRVRWMLEKALNGEPGPLDDYHATSWEPYWWEPDAGSPLPGACRPDQLADQLAPDDRVLWQEKRRLSVLIHTAVGNLRAYVMAVGGLQRHDAVGAAA